jgi:hypothetical protein
MALCASIDELVAINRWVQLESNTELPALLARWSGRLEILIDLLLQLVKQAHGTSQDVESALGPSAVRPTRTAVVLLRKGLHEEVAAKLRRAPEHDREDACRLLLHLLRVADERRRARHRHGSCAHWWHRDLGDPAVVAALRAAAAKGSL